MKFLCYLITSFTLLTSHTSSAEKENGGFILFTEVKGSIHVLMANDNHRKRRWSALGGKYDEKRDDNGFDSALRESVEETRCNYTRRSIVLGLVKDIEFRQEFEEENDFITYFSNVDYLDPAALENFPKGSDCFLKKDFTNEREKFRWVSWSNLLRDLDAAGDNGSRVYLKHSLPNETNNPFLRGAFAESLSEMRKAQLKGQFKFPFADSEKPDDT